jgi:hypothetical protein
LPAIADAGTVERAANNVIADTREVLYTTTAYQYDRVFLQVMTFTANI